MICKHKSTKLNSYKYCYLSLTIQLNISHLFAQVKCKTVLFLTIQFSIIHLFTFSLNVRQFYLTHKQVQLLRVRVNLGAMTMKGYSAFPKASASQGPHHKIV